MKVNEMNKIRRPKVSLPSRYTDIAMLSGNGKIDRTYIKLMCSAINSYNKHKNDNMKKINRDISND